MRKLAVGLLISVFAIGAGWLWIDKPFRGKHYSATSVVVSKARFGEDWPFTVAEGDLMCEDGTNAVSFEVGTKHITRYALNNAAHIEEAKQRNDPVRHKLIEQGGEPVGPFWEDVSKIRALDADGNVMRLRPIIELGLTYCDPDFEP